MDVCTGRGTWQAVCQGPGGIPAGWLHPSALCCPARQCYPGAANKHFLTRLHARYVLESGVMCQDVRGSVPLHQSALGSAGSGLSQPCLASVCWQRSDSMCMALIMSTVHGLRSHGRWSPCKPVTIPCVKPCVWHCRLQCAYKETPKLARALSALSSHFA